MCSNMVGHLVVKMITFKKKVHKIPNSRLLMLLFGVRWTLVGSDWSDNELINFILLSVLTAVITTVPHILPRYFTTSFLWSKYQLIIAENSF